MADPECSMQLKRKKREIHTRVGDDDHEFLRQTFGVGFVSHGIRNLIARARKTYGDPREKLLASIQMHETELDHERQALLELDAENALKEKEEQERNAKREEVIAMLVNASRRHAKIFPQLWQAGAEKLGISVLELKKIMKTRIKEDELNETN